MLAGLLNYRFPPLVLPSPTLLVSFSPTFPYQCWDTNSPGVTSFHLNLGLFELLPRFTSFPSCFTDNLLLVTLSFLHLMALVHGRDLGRPFVTCTQPSIVQVRSRQLRYNLSNVSSDGTGTYLALGGDNTVVLVNLHNPLSSPFHVTRGTRVNSKVHWNPIPGPGSGALVGFTRLGGLSVLDTSHLSSTTPSSGGGKLRHHAKTTSLTQSEAPLRKLDLPRSDTHRIQGKDIVSAKGSDTSSCQTLADLCWHFSNPNLLSGVDSQCAVHVWDLRTRSPVFHQLPVTLLGADARSSASQIQWQRAPPYLLGSVQGTTLVISDLRRPDTPYDVSSGPADMFAMDWSLSPRSIAMFCTVQGSLGLWDLADPSSDVRFFQLSETAFRARFTPRGTSFIALSFREHSSLQLWRAQHPVFRAPAYVGDFPSDLPSLPGRSLPFSQMARFGTRNARIMDFDYMRFRNGMFGLVYWDQATRHLNYWLLKDALAEQVQAPAYPGRDPTPSAAQPLFPRWFELPNPGNLPELAAESSVSGQSLTISDPMLDPQALAGTQSASVVLRQSKLSRGFPGTLASQRKCSPTSTQRSSIRSLSPQTADSRLNLFGPLSTLGDLPFKSAETMGTQSSGQATQGASHPELLQMFLTTLAESRTAYHNDLLTLTMEKALLSALARLPDDTPLFKATHSSTEHLQWTLNEPSPLGTEVNCTLGGINIGLLINIPSWYPAAEVAFVFLPNSNLTDTILGQIKLKLNQVSSQSGQHPCVFDSILELFAAVAQLNSDLQLASQIRLIQLFRPKAFSWPPPSPSHTVSGASPTYPSSDPQAPELAISTSTYSLRHGRSPILGSGPDHRARVRFQGPVESTGVLPSDKVTREPDFLLPLSDGLPPHQRDSGEPSRSLSQSPGHGSLQEVPSPSAIRMSGRVPEPQARTQHRPMRFGVGGRTLLPYTTTCPHSAQGRRGQRSPTSDERLLPQELVGPHWAQLTRDGAASSAGVGYAREVFGERLPHTSSLQALDTYTHPHHRFSHAFSRFGAVFLGNGVLVRWNFVNPDLGRPARDTGSYAPLSSSLKAGSGSPEGSASTSQQPTSVRFPSTNPLRLYDCIVEPSPSSNYSKAPPSSQISGARDPAGSSRPSDHELRPDPETNLRHSTWFGCANEKPDTNPGTISFCTVPCSFLERLFGLSAAYTLFPKVNVTVSGACFRNARVARARGMGSAERLWVLVGNAVTATLGPPSLPPRVLPPLVAVRPEDTPLRVPVGYDPLVRCRIIRSLLGLLVHDNDLATVCACIALLWQEYRPRPIHMLRHAKPSPSASGSATPYRSGSTMAQLVWLRTSLPTFESLAQCGVGSGPGWSPSRVPYGRRPSWRTCAPWDQLEVSTQPPGPLMVVTNTLTTKLAELCKVLWSQQYLQDTCAYFALRSRPSEDLPPSFPAPLPDPSQDLDTSSSSLLLSDRYAPPAPSRRHRSTKLPPDVPPPASPTPFTRLGQIQEPLAGYLRPHMGPQCPPGVPRLQVRGAIGGHGTRLSYQSLASPRFLSGVSPGESQRAGRPSTGRHMSYRSTPHSSISNQASDVYSRSRSPAMRSNPLRQPTNSKYAHTLGRQRGVAGRKAVLNHPSLRQLVGLDPPTEALALSGPGPYSGLPPFPLDDPRLDPWLLSVFTVPFWTWCVLRYAELLLYAPPRVARIGHELICWAIDSLGNLERQFLTLLRLLLFPLPPGSPGSIQAVVRSQERTEAFRRRP